MGTQANFTPTPYVRTTDIASNALSVNSEFFLLTGVTLNDQTDDHSGTIVANANIVTRGGYVVVTGNIRMIDFIVSSNAQGSVGLYRADSPLLQLNYAPMQIRLGSSTPIVAAQFNLNIVKFDNPPTGVNCYFLRAVSIPGSATVDWRRLGLIEMAR